MQEEAPSTTIPASRPKRYFSIVMTWENSHGRAATDSISPDWVSSSIGLAPAILPFGPMEDGRWKNNGQRCERPSLLQPTSHLWFLLVKQNRFLTHILWPRERCVRACKCACVLPSPLAAWATEPGRPIQAGQPDLTWRGKSGQRPVRVPVTVALFFILS
ncbi:hypothetical protein CPAR01_05110 [Colletotrichum paranaense]|uniref:Uncharacterized protein n=1 Tax=Colletotrichum paranaense TaxID=1914294 RepID=A0ABQ9SQC4_9PEZI|nr:uncharacterized protein CPAR01_05110 [Colletotrichum paranaense]KAK1541723.1 hypothetical protein CPAR01_05110 [Colletotrichum paranaense]